MRRRAAILVVMLAGLTGCAYVSKQYHPAMPTFLVFFSPWSSTLDAGGAQTTSTAAAAALKDPDATVQVVGFASTIGSDAANQTLAQQRAAAVEAQLIADGVDASRVTAMSRGATTYQFTPQESRRVEIDIVHAGF
jgi:outer membrane protein OmpA-like peptidoglycan-associated protein